jgi:hypothetical protein
MHIRIFLVLFFGCQNVFAGLILEPGAGITAGSNKAIETSGLATLTHSELLMSFGFDLNLRAGYQMGWLGIGAIGFSQWESSRNTVTSSNESIFASTGYSNTMNRIGFGPMIIFSLPETGFRIMAEYFPVARAQVVWGEEKSANPFRKGDVFTGTGWGLGASYVFTKAFSLYAIYRSFSYSTAQLSGTEFSISGSRFSQLNSSGMHVGGAFGF